MLTVRTELAAANMAKQMKRIREEITTMVKNRPHSVSSMPEATVVMQRLESLDEAVRDLWRVKL